MVGFFYTMYFTATHINYYNICHRKLWLFSNGINMEHNSALVLTKKTIARNQLSATI